MLSRPQKYERMMKEYRSITARSGLNNLSVKLGIVRATRRNECAARKIGQSIKIVRIREERPRGDPHPRLLAPWQAQECWNLSRSNSLSAAILL